MGPYCEFCDFRCFVVRALPFQSGTLLMATCAAGKEHDREATGFDHTTALNPSGSRPFATQSAARTVELARSVAVGLEQELARAEAKLAAIRAAPNVPLRGVPALGTAWWLRAAADRLEGRALGLPNVWLWLPSRLRAVAELMDEPLAVTADA
jgi:hypothetical protein